MSLNRHHGIVSYYNWDKNYGFIDEILHQPDGTHTLGPRFFVHISELRPTTTVPRNEFKLLTGEYVEFDTGPAREGTTNPQALQVCGMFGLSLLCENGAVEFHRYSNNLQRQGRGGGGDRGETRAAMQVETVETPTPPQPIAPFTIAEIVSYPST